MPLDQPDTPDSPEAESVWDMPMPLGAHLEELRRRMLWALGGLLAAAILTFIYGFQIIGWLAQPMVQAQYALDFPPQTVVLDPTAGFTTVYLPVALIAALVVASPWLIFQAWQFVVVGLYARERKAVYLLAPFSTLMAGLGVAFAYYILLPVSLMFFLQFATFYPDIKVGNPNPVTALLLQAYGVNPSIDPDAAAPVPEGLEPLELPVLGQDPIETPEGAVWINRRESKIKVIVEGKTRVIPLQSDRLIAPMPHLGEYVRFAALMMLGITAAFQLPVVMLVAGTTGLFDARSIAGLRKYALFVSFAAGAILTPTDLLSMLVLALPLYFLFEFGLILMRWTTPRDPTETPV